MGREIYGDYGGQKSFYLLIDIDLHKQPTERFFRRLNVLLDYFHGNHACHFQIADSEAGGVHLLLFFGKLGSLKTRRKWITRELAKLDKLHPDVEFTKLRNGERTLNIEMYPDPSAAHRLPLCRPQLKFTEQARDSSMRFVAQNL